MPKKQKHLVVSPKDFISGPYIKCPKCGNNSFGILMICAHHYCRRCARCYYPRGHEPAAIYPLPKLNKKVMYIDQFAISNMMLLLNPATKAYQKRKVDPFWEKLFEKLDTLCMLQLIICPDSDFHRYESLLAPFYPALKRMYELLSHGLSFYDYETIRRFQIIGQLRIRLGKNDRLDLDVHRVVPGDIHAWQDRFIISLNSQVSQDLIDQIRESREKVWEGMKDVFSHWQNAKGKDFHYWYQQEREEHARVLLERYQQCLRRYAFIRLGLAQIQVSDIVPPSEVVVIHCMKEELGRAGIKEEDLNLELGEFLRSAEFQETPFIKISAMMYAAMARRAARGRKQVPNRGFMTDVNVISTLLPYCDAMGPGHDDCAHFFC